jgi:hypothetical protein
MRRLLAGLTVTLFAAVPALAAEPDKGTVSLSAPTVTWKGTSTGGFATTFSEIFLNAGGEKTPCQAPSCDTFTLEVKEVADLNVQVSSEDVITYLQIEKPDGTYVYNDGIEVEGEEPDPVTKIKIKKAAVGTYLIGAATNGTFEEAYEGQATLGTPAPPAPAAPAPAPAPAPAAPAPAAAAPAPATITAKAGKLSARKLAKSRKLPLTLNASAPVTAVKVILAAKGKAVATGTLARLEGTRKFTLKLRKKLKSGNYDLIVEGKDARGAGVGTKITLKVAR